MLRVLEKVNLKRELSRADYDQVLPELQRRLYELEKACWDNKVASMVVFEGWEAAGKGSAISTLTSRMDPRGFKLHPIQPLRKQQKGTPWLRRFWLRTPNYGEMAIFDTSWYRRVLVERVEKQVRKKEWRQGYADIAEFERMLADDGVAIVKFWLHISKKEQKKRFRKIARDPLESWRVTSREWDRHDHYEDYRVAAEEMLERTEAAFAPWTIVESTSRWYARRKVFETVIAALETRLGALAPGRTPVVRADRKRDIELRKAVHAVTGDE